MLKRNETAMPDEDAPHLLIVEARFYEAISDALLDGAAKAIEAAGATYERVQVPGALEVPGAISMAVTAMDTDEEAVHYDGFVALGVVIRGETYHFEIVANESCRGITELTLEGAAIGNGILTVENEEQAWARARRSDKDKGGDAARAALRMVELREKLGG